MIFKHLNDEHSILLPGSGVLNDIPLEDLKILTLTDPGGKTPCKATKG